MGMPPTVPEIIDPAAPPISQGKLKALWDAFRMQPLTGDPAQAQPPASAMPPPQVPPGTPPAGQPLPNGAATPVAPPVQPPVPPQANIGPPTSPVPVTPAPSPLASAVSADTFTPPPPPDMGNMPSSPRLAQLQAQSDVANAPPHPTLMKRLESLLPIAAVAGVGALTHSPSAIAGAPAAIQTVQTAAQNRRAALTAQIDQAERSQSEEYQAAEKVREQAIAAHESSQARQEVAKILGSSRQSVAETQVGGRQGVAETQVAGREQIANTQGSTARDVAETRGGYQLSSAEVAARARVEAGKYAADRAANRQQAGFSHADTKPTAQEDQRADLSVALKSYGNELREIAVRRPELFGPVSLLHPTQSGRATALRDTIGSDDPDVASISRIKHQLGIVSNSAHSLRTGNSANLASTADSIANTNQSADALVQNLDRAMKGVDTFSTYTRPTLAGKVGAGSSSAKPGTPAKPEVWVRNAAGKLVQAPQ